MKGLSMRDSIKRDMATTVRRRAATALPRVQPGDLVTADTLNAIIDAVNALSDRVAALEKRCP